MRYFAHFGHTEFILCLGYKADVIKNYFLNYDEALSNDFVLSGNGAIELLKRDIDDWKISFVDTGLNANVGQRLLAVRNHLGDEPFLANYGDILTDAPLDQRVEHFLAGDKIASIMCVRPAGYSFHIVRMGEDQTGRPDHRRRDVGPLDQRWLFHLPAGDLRLHPAGRAAGRRAVHPAHRRAPSAGRSVRGLLGSDGHPQGGPGAAARLRLRAPAMGGLAAGRDALSRCSD